MNYQLLDAEELIYLSIKASNEGRSEEAMILLKQSLLQVPNQPQALYLLALEHAHIGMFERAITEFQQILTMDENMHIARFQLGLLHHSRNAASDANNIWAPLEGLGEENALHWFIQGLKKMTEDNQQEAIHLFQQGLLRNHEYTLLNQQIYSFIQQLTSDNQREDSAISTPMNKNVANMPL
ncbi:MAG: hypothetical protein AAGB12_13265 [Pseudomonadota bacterium]